MNKSILRLTAFVLPVFLMPCFLALADEPPAIPAGPYLGQPLPGAEPRLFAPGIVSNGMNNRDVAMLPDGSEMYFGLMGSRLATILVTRQENGRWTPLEMAPFSRQAKFLDLEPFVSPDGKHFFFLSTRPRPGQPMKPGWGNQDIWMMDRTATGWGEPYNPGEPVNTEENEYFPSVTRDGTLYFTRSGADHNQSFLYCSRMINGKFGPVEKLPPAVNSTPPHYNACIAPDESYLIFCTPNGKNKIGESDYYVSFRSPDGRWSEPVNLGPTVNWPGCSASSPFVTADGRFLFFSSDIKIPLAAPVTYASLARASREPRRGGNDVYWVETGFIKKLRPAGY